MNNLESDRLALQARLDSANDIEYRRKLGQFSTPTSLANDIITFGLSHIKNINRINFLDPAFGTGAFYSALLNSTDIYNINDAVAIEIDNTYATETAKFWNSYNIKIINGDFTKLYPFKTFNLIISNPPYVRHHLIDFKEKKRIKDKTKAVSGVELSGLAGLYCHFLLQSIQWMSDDGIGGWLIPSEFMDVNYGKPLKNYLLNNVNLFRIHRFSPDNIQFNDALVPSTVVWFEKSAPKSSNILFSYGGSLNSPDIVKEISINALKNEYKWTRFPCLSQRNFQISIPKIKDYFEVKRGIATGGNDFFILDQERIAYLDLPFDVFRPVLPSVRYVKNNEIEADENGNPVLLKRLFLLDCRLTVEQIKERYPNLWLYLETGKNTVAKGYLCKNRKFWYLQEHRDPPVFVCSYMGRITNNNSAFRFILNNSNAIITNSYLGLYPHNDIDKLLISNPSLKRLLGKMLNELTAGSLFEEGRIYGGGLQKIEPKELLNVNVPFMPDLFAIKSNKVLKNRLF
ncbi:MAG: N-6 DNA methylase [Deltaproteobacteria bacterium]|nr:N-6 DNA methylase [Deltaproteobacteria bacterium]